MSLQMTLMQNLKIQQAMIRLLKYFILAALVVSSCRRPYEQDFATIKLSTDNYLVNSDEGKLMVTVYYSGAWSVSFDNAPSWATLKDESGSGVGDFRILYTKNEGPSRSCLFTIKCSDGTLHDVKLVQKGRSGVTLEYSSSSLELPADGISMRLPFRTTLSRTFIEGILPSLIPSESASWISNPSVEMDDNTQAANITGYLCFDLAENTTGESREVQLNSSIVDATETIYGTAIKVKQDSRKAYLSVLDSKKMRKGAAKGSIPFETNLGTLADEVEVSVEYPEGTEPFISDLSLSGGAVNFSISATEQDRTATFVYTFDGFGIDIEEKTSFLQTVSIVKKLMDVSALYNAFTPGETPYQGQSDEYDDAVRLYVVGGRNPNMEENINTGPNTITTEENDRTFYAQDAPENPQYAFRIKFTSSEANTLSHGDVIELVLTETTLVKESNPERLSIVGVAGDLVEVVESGVEIIPVQRTISGISDADVYKYCKVSGLEFQVKEGSFSNVREYDAILNPYTPDGLEVNQFGSNNQFAKDGAANLLFDADGNSIYMLVNMACDWRRTGDKVPQGVGSVSGVIVHNELPRWGGNVGKYSLRPLGRDDILIEEAPGSNYTTLAAWVLTKGNNREAMVTDYNWLGGYTNGVSAEEQLPQNRLLATDGPQVESAVLYSENLTFQRSKNATLRDPEYPITAQSGYRGLDVSDPSSAPKFGMSKGSVISISSNPSGWLEWGEDGKWTGGVKGIVFELSTEGVSGSHAAIGFNVASGRLNPDNKTNAFWQHQTSYPVKWKVQMAVSDDSGNTWSSYTDAVNQATALSEFTMQSNPWAGANLSHYYSYTAASKAPINTPLDNPFGIPSYRFTLPQEFFGHSLVRIRLVPTTDIVATYNEDWTQPQDYAGMHAVQPSKQKQNVHNNILLEDIYIQYR